MTGVAAPRGAGAGAASALASALAGEHVALTSIRITGARTYLHPHAASGTFAALAGRYGMLAAVTDSVARCFAARAAQPSQVWFLTLARAVVIGPVASGRAAGSAADPVAELDRALRAAAPPLGVSAVVTSLPGRELRSSAFSAALIEANREPRPKAEERTAFDVAPRIPAWDTAALHARFGLRAPAGPGQPADAGLPPGHHLLESPVAALAAGRERVGLLRVDAVGFLSHLTGGRTRSFPDVADKSAVADEWFGRRAAQIIAQLNEGQPGIALLRSGTDDLIAAGRVTLLSAAADRLRSDYQRAAGGELAAGLAVLSAGMTEADLSRAALRALIGSRAAVVPA